MIRHYGLRRISASVGCDEQLCMGIDGCLRQAALEDRGIPCFVNMFLDEHIPVDCLKSMPKSELRARGEAPYFSTSLESRPHT